MNRFTIIASSVLLVLAACAKVTPVSPPDQEITFTVANLAQATKASAFNPEESFGTFAYWTPNSWWYDEDPSLFMNNEKISLLSGGVWAPADPHYWTKSGTISFASYAPYCAAKGTLGFTVAPAYSRDHHFTFTDYTIVDETNVDLMIADDSSNKNCTQATNTSGEAVVSIDEEGNEVNSFKGVPTLFTHALSRVRFVFQQKLYGNPSVEEENSWIEVTSVEVLNLFNKNTFTDNKWNLAAAQGNVAYAYLAVTENPVKIAKASAGTPTQVGEPKIVLPQILATVNDDDDDQPVYNYGNQTLRVYYNIHTKFKSNPTVQVQSGLTEDVVLGKVGLDKWEMNQDITYRVTISPYTTDPITFDPAVTDWTLSSGELSVQE